METDRVQCIRPGGGTTKFADDLFDIGQRPRPKYRENSKRLLIGRWSSLLKHDVCKHIEITGTSHVSAEQAIRHAVEKAGTTVRNMQSFEVLNTYGDVSGNSVSQWHVTLKIAFALE